MEVTLSEISRLNLKRYHKPVLFLWIWVRRAWVCLNMASVEQIGLDLNGVWLALGGRM